MLSTKKFGILAYSIFKRWIPNMIPYFKGLKPLLAKTRMRISLEEYIASLLLTATVLVPGMTLAILLLVGVLAKTTLLTTLLIGIALMIILSITVVGVYYVYPSYKVSTLKNELDKHLPFATMHMATIAGTGVPPHMIFKMIGEFKEYGEVATTCKRMYRDVSVLGYDTISALSNEAQRTPSNTFRDLLWGIVATIRSGGDLREMLLNHANALMSEERRVEAKYVETLSMLAEVYSTIFVAGIVVIFVLVSIMGIIGGLPLPMKLTLQVTTYFLVPIASIAFILVIETSKPSGV